MRVYGSGWGLEARQHTKRVVARRDARERRQHRLGELGLPPCAQERSQATAQHNDSLGDGVVGNTVPAGEGAPLGQAQRQEEGEGHL